MGQYLGVSEHLVAKTNHLPALGFGQKAGPAINSILALWKHRGNATFNLSWSTRPCRERPSDNSHLGLGWLEHPLLGLSVFPSLL